VVETGLRALEHKRGVIARISAQLMGKGIA